MSFFNALPQAASSEIRRGVISVLRKAQPPMALDDATPNSRAGEENPRTGRTLGKRPLGLCLGSVAARKATTALARVVLTTKSGLRDSLFEGTTCGVLLDFPLEAQARVIRELLPHARRVGVLRTPSCPYLLGDEGIVAILSKLDLQLEERVVGKREDVARTLLRLLERVDVLWLTPCPLWRNDEVVRYLLGKALELRRPIFAFSPSLVHAGALACIEHDFQDLGRQLADCLLRLRDGVSMRTIGYASPRSHRLVINRRVARMFDLSVPHGSAQKPIRVIER